MGKGDIGDQGNDAAEVFQDAALKKRKPEGPKAKGYCLWCGEEFGPEDSAKRFCDAECRDGYDKHPHLAAEELYDDEG